jgi:hypothetical protein
MTQDQISFKNSRNSTGGSKGGNDIVNFTQSGQDNGQEGGGMGQQQFARFNSNGGATNNN